VGFLLFEDLVYGGTMSSADEGIQKRKSWLSVDVAAVLLAVALAVLVRFGVLNHISW
jgi:hypothetical protein